MFEAAARVISRRCARQLAAALVLCWFVSPATAQQSDYHRLPPDRVMTAEACGECHVSELELWQGTPHATGFKTLHRKAAAETIAGKMGHRLIKRDSLCLSCHYTSTEQAAGARAISGVSCESCHGAGKGWIETHNDYGPEATFDNESAAHRLRRIEQSRAAGMRRPSDLYRLAASCFGCHTVPNEKLVNVGGHTTGSTGFELVAWSQGEIRHNFLAEQRGGSGENRESSIERRRLMYVVGRALELEYALRGLAAASEDGVYGKSMVRKLRNGLAEVADVAERAAVPAAQEMVARISGLRMSIGNGDELLAAAESIGAITRRLLAAPAAAQVATLDPLLRGEPAPESLRLSQNEPSAAAATGADTRAAQAPPGGEPATVAATPPAEPRPDYPRKSRLRVSDAHQFVDAGACSGCHQQQNSWWFADPHYAAADAFHDGSAKNLQIARAYGLSAGEMAQGDQMCMDCHGSVVTGKERREVWDGVSCQSCHGAAADYLEPHQEGDAADGARREGYLDALQLGMVELQNLDTRAERCAGCHYITDARLISSGHPTGADFKLAERLARIEHWDHPTAEAGALATAFAAATRARGAIPQVVMAATGTAPVRTPGATAASFGGATRVASSSAGPQPATSRPAGSPPTQQPLPPLVPPSPVSVGPLTLPPFPPLPADATVEQILEIVQQRLALLYASVKEE